MNALVIGGLGYVGSNVAYNLFKQKNNVLVLDDTDESEGYKSNRLQSLINTCEESKNSKFGIIQGDTIDYVELSKTIGSCEIDTIIYTANQKLDFRQKEVYSNYYTNNVVPLIGLMKAIELSNPKSRKRIRIIMNSRINYGSQKNPKETSLIYGESIMDEINYMKENILLRYIEQDYITGAIVRHPYVIGASDMEGNLYRCPYPPGVPEDDFFVSAFKKLDWFRLSSLEGNEPDPIDFGEKELNVVDINLLSKFISVLTEAKKLDKDYPVYNLDSWVTRKNDIVRIMEAYSRNATIELTSELDDLHKEVSENRYNVDKALTLMDSTKVRSFFDCIYSTIEAIARDKRDNEQTLG